MAVAAAGDEAATESKTKLTFLDLPAETQREIVSHCMQSDLICVALVSKHFHRLASAELYRNFHIIFPDEDDINFDSPIDGLAGGLDTFTTSDYNYAGHLKDLSMDTLSAGLKGEHAYKSYLYSASCGKFLNTLLYLMLKKSKSLEVFRWNIRVELSRPVYRELHRISSLTTLHIRMQAGDSYYSAPPPLPVSLDVPPPGPSNHWTELPPLSPGPLPVLSLPLPGNPLGPQALALGGPNGSAGPPPPLVPPAKLPAKNKSSSKRGSSSKEPSTLAGFKNLKSLSVLDIDNLDMVTELKTCVRNSSSTLNELHLSMSDSLATQARRPPPDSDPDDSDADDEFQVVPASQITSYDASGPAKLFRAQEEKKVQEAVLGRIFDVEPFLIKKFQQKGSDEPGASNGKGKEPDETTAVDPRDEFVSSLRSVSSRLMALSNGSKDFTPLQQDILDTIEKAAKKYVDSGELPTQDKEAQMVGGSGDVAATDKKDENTKTPSGDDVDPESSKGKESEKDAAGPSSANDRSTTVTSESKDTPEVSGSFNLSKGKGIQDEASPDDIDIEHMDETEDLFEESDDQQPQTTDQTQNDDLVAKTEAGISESTGSPKMTPVSSTASSSAANDRAITNLAAQKLNFKALLTQLRHFQQQTDVISRRLLEIRHQGADMKAAEVSESEQQLHSFAQTVIDIQNQLKTIEAEIEDAERQIPQKPPAVTVDVLRRRMNEYIRDTRGFSLETLSIHLIPVKASVLSRAINLRCLKQLTLLNVGNQAPIWTLLSKENKVHPLALRSVFTDNVSNAFLTCMSQLEELHDLFLLERSAKYKPESFAPRTATTIDQIRRLVLKKHMPTLKRLMIKDESNGPNWDANEKAMIAICTQGTQLEELAVSMNIHAVHAFMQYFSGLVNLRAINILHFKNNDTCIWVMREILRFIVDNLSHHPELKLEWIAMEDERVDRVVRPSDEAETSSDCESKKKRKDKGKGKVPAGENQAGENSSSAFPVLPAEGLDSDSESDDDSFDSGTRLRFKTVGPLQFYDVWGVRIFHKEVRSGRL